MFLTIHAVLTSFHFVNQTSHMKSEFFKILEITQENVIYLFNLYHMVITILELLLCVEMQLIS